MHASHQTPCHSNLSFLSPSRACLYPCRPSFYTPHSGRCHALDMINCRRYDGWRAENLGIKRMTDEAPVRLWCRVHAHAHAVRLSIMHVNQTLRIAAMPITPATVVATAVSFVVALGGDQLVAALVCHVPGRHPFPHSTPLPVPCAQGVGRSSMSHRPRLVTDLSRERSGTWRRQAMQLRAFCDAYHGRERLKARLRVTDSFALI